MVDPFLSTLPPSPMDLIIREATAQDWQAIWAILMPVFRAGETYPYPRDITEAEAHQAWMVLPTKTFVVVDGEGAILGTYYIKPNQPGQGSHVCNCGYVVSTAARGQGVGMALGRHSQAIAVPLGFRAMQFNCVVSTNGVAVYLWQKLGLAIVGTLPGAFHHPTWGYVDAYVMYQSLVSG